MINSRIVNMIATATNMLNSKILDVLINMNNSKTSTNIAIVKRQIGTWHTYRTVVDEVVVGAAMSTAWAATVAARRRRRWRRVARGPGDLPGSRAVMKDLSSRAERFPKTLFALSRTGSQRRAVPERFRSRLRYWFGVLWHMQCTTLYSAARENPNGYNVGQVHAAHV